MKNLEKVTAFFMFCLFAFNMNGQTSMDSEFTYNFYQNAHRATWKSTTHGSSDVYTLRFGIDHRHLGSARRVKKTMEDGRIKNVLHTHPRWTANGVIRGYFPLTKKIPSQTKLTGYIGFIRPSGSPKSDGARFLIYIKYYDPATRKYKNVKIFDFYKVYNGKMKYVNIDLSRFAGKQAKFELRVDTGKKPTEDWAAWYKMNISPKGKAASANNKPLSTINRAVNAAILGPTAKGKKIFGHTFNFERSVVVKVNARTGVKTVYGAFDHHKRFQQDDVYSFKAVFNSRNKLLKYEAKVNSGGFIPESRVRLGPPPFKKTSKGLSSATIDRLANEARIRLAGRNLWQRTSKEIALIIAKTAVSYKQ